MCQARSLKPSAIDNVFKKERVNKVELNYKNKSSAIEVLEYNPTISGNEDIPGHVALTPIAKHSSGASGIIFSSRVGVFIFILFYFFCARLSVIEMHAKSHHFNMDLRSIDMEVTQKKKVLENLLLNLIIFI